MAPRKKFFITTAIPYVNDRPHIGHALEFVQADAMARYHRVRGDDVLLLSGSDENAIKNVQAAEQAGVPVQEFIDANAELFRELASQLGVQFDAFQKGSDRVHHYPASQELWRRCDAAGDIYRRAYEGLYCIGCELFYTPDELSAAGECYEHPGRKLERIAEENYFFRLSRYQAEIIRLIESRELRIVPEARRNEALAFLTKPLQDISISRSNARAKNWGVPVPGDDTQRIYVWFDALNIYQSGVGFDWDEARYRTWWPADVHVIGKGILRFHAIYWPAFLLSAKLPLPKTIFVHGYITVDGQKMSKTVGNTADPIEIVDRVGADPLRYYFIRDIPATGDGDFSVTKLFERYNGDLANGLGNLVARVAALGERISPVAAADIPAVLRDAVVAAETAYHAAFADFRLNEALASVWRLIGVADRHLNDTQPWNLGDNPEALRRSVAGAGLLIVALTDFLEPFLPETASRIRAQISRDGQVVVIKKGEGLFPRLS